MKKRNIANRAALAVGCLLLSCFLPLAGPVHAADECTQLAGTIGQERDLLTRRDKLVQAVKQCPKNADINYMLGYSLERLRKYDEAVKYYLAATEANQKYAKAYFSLGDIYMSQDETASAAKAFEKGLKLEPGNERAKLSLAEATAKLKAAGGKNAAAEAVAVAPQPKEAAPKPPEVGSMEGPILRMMVLFQNNSAVLSDDEKDQLSLVMGRAMQSPSLKDAVFEVQGHNDEAGSDKASMTISKKRAEAVKKYLVDSCDIDPKRLTIAAYGHSRPAVPNTTQEGRKLNRRVEFKRLK